MSAALPTDTTMSALKRIRLVSYNIWFESIQMVERTNAIVHMMKREKPDVMCFQEVIQRSCDILTKAFKDEYHIAESFRTWYGVMMFLKKTSFPRANFQGHMCRSRMGRNLLVATTATRDNIPVMIGTIHLESLNSHPIREKQLAQAESILRACPNSILCGDFNFDSYRNYSGGGGPLENNSLAEILPTYVDCWLEVNKEELAHGEEEERQRIAAQAQSTPPREKRLQLHRGYTFDSWTNPFLMNHKTERMRYDRIISNGQGCLKPVDSYIIGQRPLDREVADNVPEGSKPKDKRTKPRRHKMEPGIFPSDHYGLVVDFSIVDGAAPATAEWLASAVPATDDSATTRSSNVNTNDKAAEAPPPAKRGCNV